MPSGKTHDRLTVLGMIPTFFLSNNGLSLPLETTLFLLTGFWIGGFYLSPDLDTPSRPYFRWGPFRFIWIPYQWMVKHRSNLSHGVITGTLVRLLYLFSFLTIIFIVVKLLWFEFIEINSLQAFNIQRAQLEYKEFISLYWKAILFFSIGTLLGAFVHISADLMNTAWLKTFK
jgi:uncharacterized metal-binding protein